MGITNLMLYLTYLSILFEIIGRVEFSADACVEMR